MRASLKQLHYVASAGHFASIALAAKHLNISQSSVGAAIDLIESEFKRELFVRQRSRGLKTTAEGEVFLYQLEVFLNSANHFARSARSADAHPAGEIIVGCFAPLAPHVLPHILKALATRFPDVKVRLREGHLQRIQSQLRDGLIDIALTYDLSVSSTIAYESLCEIPPHVLVSTDDPLANRPFLRFDDIADKAMILLDIPESQAYFEAIFRRMPVPPRVIHRTETYETVRSLVSAGLGFSLLNLRPVIDHSYVGETLACLPLNESLPAPYIVLATRHNSILTRPTQAFSDCCRDYFKSSLANRHCVSMNHLAE